MDDRRIEEMLIILRALEGRGSEFEDIAKLYRERLSTQVSGTRIDFHGQEHQINLDELLTRSPNITSETLPLILSRLKQMADKHFPPGKIQSDSLLGAGRYSIIRDEKSLVRDQLLHSVNCLPLTKHHMPAYQNKNVNIAYHIRANKLRPPIPTRRAFPPELFANYNLYSKVMGHLSSAYCVCFDQTGQCIFTGSDDYLIKIWSAKDGRLLKTLRGHDGHISDMSVSFDNRLLATAGMDKIIRIWDLKTTKLLDCLVAHSATVTSIKFCPYNRHIEDDGEDDGHGNRRKRGNSSKRSEESKQQGGPKEPRKSNTRYLVSTSNDGTVVFWTYDTRTLKFQKKEQLMERNRLRGQITCSSFSTGGSFLACGSSDNYIHVYGFHPNLGPYQLNELSHHTDKVDSIQFCNNGFRFVSGSKDGTAIIWTYRKKNWHPLKLDMSKPQAKDTAGPSGSSSSSKNAKDKGRPVVLIVQWSRDDRYVITTLVDYSIRIWDSRTGECVYILREHKHDVYLIESHPQDPRVFVSASHDGTLILWDIERGKVLQKIYNILRHPEVTDQSCHPSIYDVKFSPDGTKIATTDSHGYLAIYGMGPENLYKDIPDQMFFSIDYRPVIRDVRHFVMDEQTHIVPHLMPRPTLVDMNGNPYSRDMQYLVPDFSDGSSVVPQLTAMQSSIISKSIENHSIMEDDEFLIENGHYTPAKCEPCGDEDDSDATEIDSDATEIDSDTTEIVDASQRYTNYEQSVQHHANAQRRYNTRRNDRRRERTPPNTVRYSTRARSKRVRLQ